MVKITRLTNQTRLTLRAPLSFEPVSPALLASLFPVIRKLALKPSRVKDQQKTNENSQQKTGGSSSDTAAKTPLHTQRAGNDSQFSQTKTREGTSSQKSTANPAQPVESDPQRKSERQDANNRTTRPPGLFVPTTRVVRPGSQSSSGRQINPSSANPSTRPVSPAVSQNSGSRNNNIHHENGPARNGFSHQPVALSHDTPRHSGAPKPLPLQSRQEPPTQLPLEEKKPETSNLPPAARPEQPSTPPPRKPGPPLLELRQLLEQHPNLPAQTSLLGVCDDGLPVLLDLNDPKPGALLIMGDEREQQLDMLRSAIASLAMRNTARSVQILIISLEPQTWRDWVAAQGYQRFCIGIEGVDDLELLSEWVIRLGDWTEQRRTGEISGPPVLVVLDTLGFMPRLAYDIRLNFEWMAKEGPAAQIWPLATISSDLANVLNGRRMLRSFRTRVLGFADNASFYTQLAGLNEKEAEQFGEPGVFAVQLGEEWLRFRLPGAKSK